MHLKSYEEAATLSEGKAVLDLGCNNGYGTTVISRVCDRVVGLDVSPTAIADAREQYGNRGIDFRLFDGQSIPFPDDSFDVVVTFQVVEHIENTATYLSEIARVLRPNGVALFTTPNAAIRLDPGMKPWNHFHVREYLVEELSTLLRATFSGVSVKGLFAVEDLYRTEFERCQKALTNARKRAPPQPVPFWWRARDTAASWTKAVLPRAVVDLIRSRNAGVTAHASTRTLDQEVINRYSTQDFFYREEDLDRALDLIAVCRRAQSV
jgi:SAM-dependent methyltransferase